MSCVKSAVRSLCCAGPPPTAHGYIHPEKVHTHRVCIAFMSTAPLAGTTSLNMKLSVPDIMTLYSGWQVL